MARTTLARRTSARSPPSTRRSARRGRRPSTVGRRSTTSRRATTSRRSSARRTATRSRSSTRSHPSARSRPVQGQKEIQIFLDGFVTDLTAGDGRAAAARFEYPALMVMSGVGVYGGAQMLQDEATVAEFFGKAPEMYQEKGVHQTTAVIEQVDWIADDLALVRVHLPYLDEDGSDMGDAETSIYLLRKDGDDFRICSAITLGAESDRATASR